VAADKSLAAVPLGMGVTDSRRSPDGMGWLIGQSFTDTQAVALYKLPLGVKVFSAEFVQKYDLGTASNAQRAVNSLLERDVIDRSNGSFIIVDRFFRIWIRDRQLT